MPRRSREETACLLADLAAGDDSAASRLFPLVYGELRAIAGSYFRRQPANHTLQPTALVHEAFLRLVDQTQAQWIDRSHFLAVAAKAMRRILINHAHRRAAARRGGNRQRLTLIEELTPCSRREFDLIALDEALNRLAEVNERMSEVVEVRFFGGMTVEEAAHALGVSKRTVETDWEMARAWLSREMSDGSSE